MDILQAIVNILDSMGGGLVTAIVIMVALILIWLIIRASRRGSDPAKSAGHQDCRSRYGLKPAEHETQETRSRHVQPEKASVADAAPPEAPVVAPQLQVEIPVGHGSDVNPEPEDSVLHRHYDAEQAAKKAMLADPYPTDSVLRRHYDTLHKIQLNTAGEKTGIANESAPAMPNSEQSISSKASISEQAMRKVNQAIVTPVSVAQAKQAANDLLPQDSVLKRHFISQLRTEIAADLLPRPTDSVLQRHYDALIQYELEKRLRS